MSTQEDVAAWTARKFRSGSGRAGGPFADAPLPLSPTPSATTRQETRRILPVAALPPDRSRTPPQHTNKESS